MIAALALLASPAAASTLPQWTGPGENACAGRCPVEWALDQLPEATRADVVQAMRRAPVPVLVRDGDYLSLMTYYRGGPVAQHGVVAVIDAPEPATGWCVSGGCFVQVHACANWAMTTNTNMAAGGISPAVTAQQPGGAAAAMPPAIFVGGGGASYLRASDPLAFGPTEPGGAPTDPAPITPAVPLPAAGWLLLSALAGLWWRARR